MEALRQGGRHPLRELEGLRFELLASHHDRIGFGCEETSLTRFLRERALRDMRARLSATHVLVGTDPHRILGYHTLAAASIPFDRIPEAERKRAKLSRYQELSATLIARLARDERWKGRGLGDLLVVDALRRAWSQTAEIGAAFVIVDAVNELAAGFYESHGFNRFADEACQLFLPMASLAKLSQSVTMG